MTRDQQRSLWLAYAVAGRIAQDPPHALELATKNLATMTSASRGRRSRWLEEWAALIDGPIDRLLLDYTSPTPRGRELRQNAPYAGLLSESEREMVLAGWKQSR